MKKKLCIIMALFISCVLFAFLIIQKKNTDSVENLKLSVYSKQINNYNKQLASLQDELTELQNQKRTLLLNKGTFSLVFKDLDPLLYTEVFPITTEYSVCGTFVLEKDKLPGAEGCLTKEQFDEMLQAGWDYCIGWNGEGDFSSWFREMNQQLQSIGVSSSTVYFYNNTCPKSIKDTLRENQICIALHHGEEDRAMTSVNFNPNSIWFVGVEKFVTNRIEIRMNEVLEKNGSSCVEIAFSGEDNLYNRSSFLSLIKDLQSSQTEYDLKVLPINSSYSFRSKHYTTVENEVTQINNLIKNVKAEIESITVKIEEVKDSFSSEN